MKKIIFITVAVIALLGSAYGYIQYNKPHKDILKEQAFLTLSGTELISKIAGGTNNSNEILNKVIEVTGRITEIEEGKESTIIILNEGIKCELEHLEKNALSVNEEVKIKGFYAGFDEMFNEISIAKCHIIN